MGPIGGRISDQLRLALGKGAADKALCRRHLEAGDIHRSLTYDTFEDTFVCTMQKQ